MKATRTPITLPRPSIYTCTRCGITKWYANNEGRAKPTMCKDCLDVLAYVDKCGTVSGWSAHHRNGDYPVCDPCRLAYNDSRRKPVGA